MRLSADVDGVSVQPPARSPTPARPLEHDLAEAAQAFADEDLHGTLAWIELPLHELEEQPPAVAARVLDLYASVLEGWVSDAAARLARHAARAVDDADTLHRLGVVLVDARELAPALGVLARATRLDPGRAALWHERATAERLRGQPGRAADLLEAAPPHVWALPRTRALHALARLLDRDVGPARTVAPELARADNPLLRAQGARLEAMLLRHEALVPCAWEDPRARARAWHAVWTAEAVVEPLAAPRPTLASVRAALSAVVEAVRGVEPVAVTAPLHRDSEVLARALALLLGVPFAREPASGPSVAVAWDAASLAPGEGARLRADGRALYVHASRGVEEPASEAHLVGCLSGPWRAPWGHDGEVLALVGEPAPPRDVRPLSAIAADVAATSLLHLPDLPDEQAWRWLVGALAALPPAARTPVRVAHRDPHGADDDGLGPSPP